MVGEAIRSTPSIARPWLFEAVDALNYREIKHLHHYVHTSTFLEELVRGIYTYE